MRAERERLRCEILGLGPEEAEAELCPHHRPQRTFCWADDINVTVDQLPEHPGSGGLVWKSGEHLCDWLCSQRDTDLLRGFSSAVELGCGTGIVSIVLAQLGISRVVATDGGVDFVALCESNAAKNGVQSILVAVQHVWGADVAPVASMLLEPNGNCAPLLIFSDVLYKWAPEPAVSLEQSLRALIALGGCRLVVHAWKRRNGRGAQHHSSTPTPWSCQRARCLPLLLCSSLLVSSVLCSCCLPFLLQLAARTPS